MIIRRHVSQFIFIGISSALVLVLTGCGNSPTKDENGNGKNGDEKQAKTEHEKPGADGKAIKANQSQPNQKKVNVAKTAAPKTNEESDKKDGNVEKKPGTESVGDNSANEKRALDKIRDTVERADGELDLGRLGLTSVPMEVFQLKDLSELFLYGNQLSTLPPELEKLTNLTMLDLRNNQFTKLPPGIVKLENLTQLVLTGNPITDSEIELITKIKKLRVLVLGKTKLTSKGKARIKKAMPTCIIM